MSTLSSLISQLERQRTSIERAISALREAEGSGHAAAASVAAATGGATKKRGRRGGKRRLSPEGRARIAEAARKRWAMKRAQEGRKGGKKTAA